jgi:hypothetical protein
MDKVKLPEVMGRTKELVIDEPNKLWLRPPIDFTV